MSHLSQSSSRTAINNGGAFITHIAERERSKPKAEKELNHCGSSEIQCTEMGNDSMNPKKYIENTDFVNGFKVVTTRPALSDAEYKEKEQKIVEDIVKSLSVKENRRLLHTPEPESNAEDMPS